MRGLILGNSHAGALRLAILESRRLEVDFLAIPGGAGPKIRVENGRLFPDQAKARIQSTIGNVAEDGLDPSSYDYVVFASLGLAAVRPEFPHPCRRFVLAGLGTPRDPDARLLSAAMAELAIAAALRAQPGVEALRQLAGLYDGPVYCVPRPLPVAGKLGAESPLTQIYGDRLGVFLKWQAGVQARTIRVLTREARPDIEVFDLPDPAWAEEGTTPVSYMLNQDPWHMNASYGALVVDQICASLPKPAPTEIRGGPR